MVLSSLASLLAVIAFLLAYVFRNDWAIVLWWAVLPELLVFTLAYLVADFAHSTTRRQATFSLLIALPALITQVWFFENLHL
jgi:fatty-acid desaturase